MVLIRVWREKKWTHDSFDFVPNIFFISKSNSMMEIICIIFLIVIMTSHQVLSPPPPSFLQPVKVPVQNFVEQARRYLLDLLFTRTHTHARIESYWCASKYQRDPLWPCYPSQLRAIWFLGPNKSWKILSVCNNVTLVSDWKWRSKMALVRVFDPLSQVSQIITSLQNCPQSQLPQSELPQSQLPQSESGSEKTSQSKAQDHNLHHLD